MALHVRRSGQIMPSAQSMRNHVDVNLELVKENENLRSGLLWMKMYISDIENSKVGMTPAKSKKIKKPAPFFTSVTTRKTRTGDELFPGDKCRPGKVAKRQKSVRRGTNSDRLFSQSMWRVSRATCRPG
ncbi:hypothetical protein Tco_0702010 [Tanacetum coccineum]|uniref:Uncharacterized protein n=1 Tax=Tanacetum coccineum TaxID=301880 RepID=A0ABQ4XUT0_9ASTR